MCCATPIIDQGQAVFRVSDRQEYFSSTHQLLHALVTLATLTSEGENPWKLVHASHGSSVLRKLQISHECESMDSSKQERSCKKQYTVRIKACRPRHLDSFQQALSRLQVPTISHTPSEALRIMHMD